MGLELASKTRMNRAPCCRISQSVSGLPAFTFWVCSLNFDPLQVFQLFPPRPGNMDGSIQSRSRWPGQLCSLKVNKKLQIEIEKNVGQVSFAV